MGAGALKLVEQGSDLQSGRSYSRHYHTDSISGILFYQPDTYQNWGVGKRETFNKASKMAML